MDKKGKLLLIGSAMFGVGAGLLFPQNKTYGLIMIGVGLAIVWMGASNDKEEVLPVEESPSVEKAQEEIKNVD